MNLRNIFAYHHLQGEQPNQVHRVREAAEVFAQAIVDNVPPGADQTAAVRKVREAMMTANAGIALGGQL